MKRLLFAVLLTLLSVSPALADPPFLAAQWANLITSTDSTGLSSVTYSGRGERGFYDYRPREWITVNAYLFDVRFSGRSIEFQVNPEFESEEASRKQVDTYAAPLGRMPSGMLSRIKSVHINDGAPAHPDLDKSWHLNAFRRDPKVFGGSYENNSMTIHAGSGEKRIQRGTLEEVLLHESAHVTLQNHQDESGWHEAQEADGEFISNYARDNPDREDVAESLVAYFALRYRADRISAGVRAAIEEAIPNRMEYFDGLALNWSPYMSTATAPTDLKGGVKDLVDEALDDLQDDSAGREAAESVPALPAAGVLLLATLLGLLGRRLLRVG